MDPIDRFRFACKNNDHELAAMISVKYGVSWHDEYVRACSRGELDIVKVTFNAMSIFSYKDGTLYACRNGHYNVIEFIIQSGNVMDLNLELETACQYGHCSIASLLMANGATDVNRAMMIACGAGKMESVMLMIKHGAISWDIGLLNACKGGYYDIATLMIQNGATIETNTFLSACYSGNMDTILLLLNTGAIALDVALETLPATHNRKEIAILLIEKGADINHCPLYLLREVDIMLLLKLGITTFGKFEKLAQYCRGRIKHERKIMTTYMNGDVTEIILAY